MTISRRGEKIKVKRVVISDWPAQEDAECIVKHVNVDN